MMNTVDIVLLLLIAAAFCGAVAACVRNRKKGKGCGGCCSDCSECAYKQNNKQN